MVQICNTNIPGLLQKKEEVIAMEHVDLAIPFEESAFRITHLIKASNRVG